MAAQTVVLFQVAILINAMTLFYVLRTHYGYEQLVNTATGNVAILDKMRSIKSPVYGLRSVIDELGTSDHKMSHRGIQHSIPEWSRKLLPGAWAKLKERCLLRPWHRSDGSICAYVRGTCYVFPRNCGTFIGYNVVRLRL